VINYRDEDAATAIKKLAPEGVDLVVEVAISANSQLDIDVSSRVRRGRHHTRRS
jgi:NADPH2:quinone reductase